MERKLSIKAILITVGIIVVAVVAITLSYTIKGSKDNSNTQGSSSQTVTSEGNSEASTLTDQDANYDERVIALEKLSDEGKYEEVEIMAEQLLQTKPNLDTVLGALWELTLAESRLGKYEEAFAHANEMNDYEPSSSHFLLGLIYFDKQDYVMAKKELLEAKQLEPLMSEQIDIYIRWMEEKAGV
jgi:tetratricopeptide (TPR) repeat protein